MVAPLKTSGPEEQESSRKVSFRGVTLPTKQTASDIDFSIIREDPNFTLPQSGTPESAGSNKLTSEINNVSSPTLSGRVDSTFTGRTTDDINSFKSSASTLQNIRFSRKLASKPQASFMPRRFSQESNAQNPETTVNSERESFQARRHETKGVTLTPSNQEVRATLNLKSFAKRELTNPARSQLTRDNFAFVTFPLKGRTNNTDNSKRRTFLLKTFSPRGIVNEKSFGLTSPRANNTETSQILEHGKVSARFPRVSARNRLQFTVRQEKTSGKPRNAERFTSPGVNKLSFRRATQKPENNRTPRVVTGTGRRCLIPIGMGFGFGSGNYELLFHGL